MLKIKMNQQAMKKTLNQRYVKEGGGDVERLVQE
jgi:hypothetical protein